MVTGEDVALVAAIRKRTGSNLHPILKDADHCEWMSGIDRAEDF
jgi:hypothetical protein